MEEGDIGSVHVTMSRMSRATQQWHDSVVESVHHPVPNEPRLAMSQLAVQVVQPGPGASVECRSVKLRWLPVG